LIRGGVLKSKRGAQAMLEVDRSLFVLDSGFAYEDSPQSIGCNATISAPHMHAHCLDLLEPHLGPGASVLDVGSGSGYLAVVFAAMVGKEGRVVGIEHIQELVSRSIQASQQITWAKEMTDSGQLLILQGDGRQGYAPGAPYDAIHVGAAAPHVPAALTDQLKPGGRLVIPVGAEGGIQELLVVDKSGDGAHLQQRKVMGVMYVPLTSMDHQLA